MSILIFPWYCAKEAGKNQTKLEQIAGVGNDMALYIIL